MANLTIFTPTYNRAYTLPNLYRSLLLQTNKDFIWLVIDDGSTDNTKKLILSYINKNLIKIVYKRIPNNGKMNAHNVAVSMTNTPLFFCVDSDDTLECNAVKNILFNYNEIINNNKIAGIIAYRKILNPKRTPTKFPTNIRTSTLSNLYKNGFIGDTSIIFKTEIIKQYPFPIISGEKFVTEALIYSKIDQKYAYKLLEEYLINCEYLKDGYTNNLIKYKIENPNGYALYYEQEGRLESNIKKIIKNYVFAFAYRKMGNKKVNFRVCLKLIMSYPFVILFRNTVVKKIIGEYELYLQQEHAKRDR